MKLNSRDKKMTEKQFDQCRRKLAKTYVVIGIDHKGDLIFGFLCSSKSEAMHYSRLWARNAKYLPYVATVRCSDIVRED
jgi:hypothetical protein